MQHAEAQDQLSDLALEPGRLARLGDDPSPGASDLRRHLAECGPCSAELAVWLRAWDQIGAALEASVATDDDAGDAWAAIEEDGRVRTPSTLRARTLARVAAEGVARAEQGELGAPTARARISSRPTGAPSPTTAERATGPRSATRRRRWAPWLAIAAALVIALGAGSLAWTVTRDLDQAQTENAGLTATMASLDRVIATPVHWTVTLRTPDGGDGGVMAWSGSEIAVITTALPRPADGQSYRCWVERDGVRTPMGPMWFSGSTGYWAGPIGGWAPLLSPGSRLGVSLVPADGGPATPLLVGSL